MNLVAIEKEKENILKLENFVFAISLKINQVLSGKIYLVFLNSIQGSILCTLAGGWCKTTEIVK